MTIRILVASALLLATATTGALAQGFSGGTVSLEHTGFDGDADVLNSRRFEAGVEFAATSQLAFGVDVTNTSPSEFDQDVSGLGVHGIFAVNTDVKLGVWYSREKVEDFDDEISSYGIEAAYSLGQSSLRGYLGTGDAEGTDFTLLGVDTAYDLGNGFSVITAIDYVDLSDQDFTLSTIEVGGAYEIMPGASVFASIGNLTIDTFGSTGDENFFKVGAEFSFGPQGGTTFKQHGLFDTFPPAT